MAAVDGSGAPVRLAGVTQALVIVKGITAGILGIMLAQQALALRAYRGFDRLSEPVLAMRHQTDRVDSWNSWLLLVTVVTWLVWQYRLHAYLRRVSTEPPPSGPWASVGWWFVPFANLAIPFRVMEELARAAAARGGTRYDERVVFRWKVPWLGQLIAAYLVIPVGISGGVGGLIASDWIVVIGELLTVAAVVPAVLLVRTLTLEAVAVPDAEGVSMPVVDAIQETELRPDEA